MADKVQRSPLSIVQIPIADLKPAEYNPRIITEEEFAGLQASIDIFGFVEPLVVNHDRTIIGGHQRYQAAIRLGYDHVPAVILDLDKHAEQKLNVVLNSGAISGKYDELKLAEILEQLKLDDDYTTLRLDTLEPLHLETEVEEDEAPEVSSEPAISKLGEIYQLGRHRLMCGDATDGKSVNELLDGVIPTLMVTDPPYGVNYEAEWRVGYDLNMGKKIGLPHQGRAVGHVINDDKVDWAEAYELFGGDIAYVFHGGLHTLEVANSLMASGFELVSQIIWVKQHFVFSRGDYHWQHEPIWYVVRKGSKHGYVGDRKQTTVWNIQNNNPIGHDKDHEEKLGHSTQKPVAVMAKPIENNSSVGQAVYDPFLGSGTTLIAAEQLNRVCYGLELAPEYCDVIRKRYAKFVGQEEQWQQATPVIK